MLGGFAGWASARPDKSFSAHAIALRLPWMRRSLLDSYWRRRMAPELLGVASAFGLASAAGLNTTLPLFPVGVLYRFGALTLAPPYDAVGSDLALVGLGVLVAVEFGADKVPGVDSVLQAVQWPLTLAAGAILFAS